MSSAEVHYLLNGDLHNLYTSNDIDILGEGDEIGEVGCRMLEGNEKQIQILVGRSE
jgi:hypothetical protein